jgi:hypothetical protein
MGAISFPFKKCWNLCIGALHEGDVYLIRTSGTNNNLIVTLSACVRVTN